MAKNKKHKSRFSTKGELKQQSKGKVDTKKAKPQIGSKSVKFEAKGNAAGSKDKRKQRAEQIRNNKRKVALFRQRFGGSYAPPRIVGVIGLSQLSDSVLFANSMLQDATKHEDASLTYTFEDRNLNVTVLSSKFNMRSQLDIVKVADVLVLLIHVVEDAATQLSAATTQTSLTSFGICIDEAGQKLLSVITAFAFPTTIVVLQGLDEIPNQKQRAKIAKAHERYFTSYLQRVKVMAVAKNNRESMAQLLRAVQETKIVQMHWREEQSYMVVEREEWEDGDNGTPNLVLSGYVRGKVSPNQLFHISHYGTFEAAYVKYEDGDEKQKILPKDPHPIQWCKEAEINDDMSWNAQPYVPSAKIRTDHQTPDVEVNEDDSASVMQDRNRTDEELFMDEAEDERNFPDETEVPFEQAARLRFARYRGLESFRTSNWDPYESLPADYSKIFMFSDFNAVAKDCIKEQKEYPVPASDMSTWVTVALKGIPKEEFIDGRHRQFGEFLTLSALRKHEQQFTVLNVHVQHNGDFGKPLKSKQRVLMHIGFRVIQTNPVFSEANHAGNRSKFLRFFQPEDKFCIASVYGPATYKPCPVLMFQDSPSVDIGASELVAFGEVLSCDPLRLILKKVVLTGAPYKIHRKQAVIRTMFFNAEDVEYFKPVHLYTKAGFNGRILQPLGQHGKMKCQFNTILPPEDTICMDLWKRVYPKWTSTQVSCMPSVEKSYSCMPHGNLDGLDEDENGEEEGNGDMME